MCIDQLARDLIRLSGLEPDVDVEIVYTGLRPGEKMFEELCLNLEEMDRTRHEKIFIVKPVKEAAALQAEIEQLRAIIGWDCHASRELCAVIGQTLGSPEPCAVQHVTQEHKAR